MHGHLVRTLRFWILMLAVSVLSAGPRHVRVGVFPHAPAIFMDTDGTAKGFFVDMLQAVAKEEGWQLTFVPGTWAEGLERARRGEVDLLTSVAKTPEREQYLRFGSESAFTVWSLIYEHPGEGVRTILDLRGHRVGVMEGDINGQRFRELCTRFEMTCTFVPQPSFDAVLRAVERGEVDAGVTSSAFGYFQERQYRVDRTPVVVNPFPLYFAAPAGADPSVLAALDRYLAQGRGDAQAPSQVVVRRWLFPEAPGQRLPRWVVRTGLGGLALLVLAGIGLLIIRAQVRRATARIAELHGALHEELEARTRLELQMAQAQKLESLGLLAGGIAHDFNNLMTALTAHLDLGLLSLPAGHPGRRHLVSMGGALRRMTELTRQMLAYSGKGHFVVEPQDLNQRVEEVAQLLEVSRSKKVSLDLQLSPRLACIQADGAQLQQVVMNLVTNASEAIGDREGTIRVATWTEELTPTRVAAGMAGQSVEPGPCVVLEVRDTGCGMPPEVLARIFDPFFTTKTTGRGLGLSATLGILRGHRAGYEIESEAGAGTTFRIWFPALPHGQRGCGEEAAGMPVPEGLRVLLVEDEPDVREASVEALQALGACVTEAGDGLEALDLLATQGAAWDVVLLDLTMPRLDGRETLRGLRATHPHLPVILCSGYSRAESLEGLASEEALGFLAKPYSLAELQAALVALVPVSPRLSV